MNRITTWAKRHIFWSIMIVIMIIGIVLSYVGVVNARGIGRLVGNLIGIYLVIWVITKITLHKKKEET